MAEKKRVDDYSFEQESVEYDKVQLKAVEAELERIKNELADATQRRKSADGPEAIIIASEIYQLTERFREAERHESLLQQRIQKSQRAHAEGREELLAKDPISKEIN